MTTTESPADQGQRRLVRILVDIDVDNCAYESIVFPGVGADAPVTYGDLIVGYVDNVVSNMLRDDAQVTGQEPLRMILLDGVVTAVEVVSSRTLPQNRTGLGYE